MILIIKLLLCTKCQLWRLPFGSAEFPAPKNGTSHRSPFYCFDLMRRFVDWSRNRLILYFRRCLGEYLHLNVRFKFKFVFHFRGRFISFRNRSNCRNSKIRSINFHRIWKFFLHFSLVYSNICSPERFDDFWTLKKANFSNYIWHFCEQFCLHANTPNLPGFVEEIFLLNFLAMAISPQERP